MLEKPSLLDKSSQRTIPQLDLRALFEANREEYLAALTETVENCGFIGGKEVEQFEKDFTAYALPGGHTVGVGNGTDAIVMAVRAMELPPGSRAIVPAMTYFATAEGIEAAGVKVDLVDVQAGTWLLDLDQVEAAMTPQTRLIAPVHLYGQMVEMDKCQALAEKHELYILEDSAQSQGAQWKGHGPGYFGDVATYSFYPGKNLGAFGDAGGITSLNADLIQKCRIYGNHGGIGKFEHDVIGQNSRLDGIQAAILNVKLKYLEQWNQARRQAAARYVENLQNVEGIELPLVQEHAKHVYHQFVVLVEKRDAFQTFLKDHGVMTGLHYPFALHELGAFKQAFKGKSFVQAQRVARHGISLPMGPTLSLADVDEVCEVIRSFFQS